MIIRFSSRRPYSSATTASFDSSKFHFIQLLRSCKNLKSLLQIHAQLLTQKIDFNDSVRTLLVNSYSSFQKSDFSLSVFNSSPKPSNVLWNSTIRALTKTGEHTEAISLYQKMLVPDKHTFTFVLKACAGNLDSENGISIHEEVARRGLQGDTYICTALLDMYCRVGMVDNACQVFDSMPEWDIVSWNAMIGGFSQNHQPHRALEMFMKMPTAGLSMVLSPEDCFFLQFLMVSLMLTPNVK